MVFSFWSKLEIGLKNEDFVGKVDVYGNQGAPYGDDFSIIP